MLNQERRSGREEWEGEPSRGMVNKG